MDRPVTENYLGRFVNFALKLDRFLGGSLEHSTHLWNLVLSNCKEGSSIIKNEKDWDGGNEVFEHFRAYLVDGMNSIPPILDQMKQEVLNSHLSSPSSHLQPSLNPLIVSFGHVCKLITYYLKRMGGILKYCGSFDLLTNDLFFFYSSISHQFHSFLFQFQDNKLGLYKEFLGGSQGQNMRELVEYLILGCEPIISNVLMISNQILSKLYDDTSSSSLLLSLDESQNENDGNEISFMEEEEEESKEDVGVCWLNILPKSKRNPFHVAILNTISSDYHLLLNQSECMMKVKNEENDFLDMDKIYGKRSCCIQGLFDYFSSLIILENKNDYETFFQLINQIIQLSFHILSYPIQRRLLLTSSSSIKIDNQDEGDCCLKGYFCLLKVILSQISSSFCIHENEQREEEEEKHQDGDEEKIISVLDFIQEIFHPRLFNLNFQEEENQLIKEEKNEKSQMFPSLSYYQLIKSSILFILQSIPPPPQSNNLIKKRLISRYVSFLVSSNPSNLLKNQKIGISSLIKELIFLDNENDERINSFKPIQSSSSIQLQKQQEKEEKNDNHLIFYVFDLIFYTLSSSSNQQKEEILDCCFELFHSIFSFLSSSTYQQHQQQKGRGRNLKMEDLLNHPLVVEITKSSFQSLFLPSSSFTNNHQQKEEEEKIDQIDLTSHPPQTPQDTSFQIIVVSTCSLFDLMWISYFFPILSTRSILQNNEINNSHQSKNLSILSLSHFQSLFLSNSSNSNSFNLEWVNISFFEFILSQISIVISSSWLILKKKNKESNQQQKHKQKSIQLIISSFPYYYLVLKYIILEYPLLGQKDQKNQNQQEKEMKKKYVERMRELKIDLLDKIHLFSLEISSSSSNNNNMRYNFDDHQNSDMKCVMIFMIKLIGLISSFLSLKNINNHHQSSISSFLTIQDKMQNIFDHFLPFIDHLINITQSSSNQQNQDSCILISIFLQSIENFAKYIPTKFSHYFSSSLLQSSPNFKNIMKCWLSKKVVKNDETENQQNQQHRRISSSCLPLFSSFSLFGKISSSPNNPPKNIEKEQKSVQTTTTITTEEEEDKDDDLINNSSICQNNDNSQSSKKKKRKKISCIMIKECTTDEEVCLEENNNEIDLFDDHDNLSSSYQLIGFPTQNKNKKKRKFYHPPSVYEMLQQQLNNFQDDEKEIVSREYELEIDNSIMIKKKKKQNEEDEE